MCEIKKTKLNENKSSFFNSKKILTRYFGDKEFISYYWRLFTPALFYGIFYAFGPIIVSNLFVLIPSKELFVDRVLITSKGSPISETSFINLVFTQGNSLWNAMYFFVVAVVRSGVGAIGSALGRNDKEEIQATLRLITYILSLISFVIMVSICLDSTQILKSLQLVNHQIDQNSVLSKAVEQYINWSAISVILYGLGMLYQPMFSTYRKTVVQMFSAFFAFMFILIAGPLYLYLSPNENIYTRCNMIALIVDFYYLIIVLYFVINCLFKNTLIVETLNPKVINHKYYKDHHKRFTIAASIKIEKWRTKYFALYIVENPLRIFNFFSTGIWVSKREIKAFLYLGWPTFIDQIIWSVANVFLIIFSTNVSSSAWKEYNIAAKPASLLNSYVYSVANSFSILPSAFVAYELGLGNKSVATKNGWRLYHWGVVTALILMVLVFVIASFMPSITITNKDYLSLSIGLTMIFGVSVLFNSAYQISLNLLFCGGNRFVQINNSLVTVINSFAVIVVINNQIVYHNLWSSPTESEFYLYYSIGKFYTIIKL